MSATTTDPRELLERERRTRLAMKSGKPELRRKDLGGINFGVRYHKDGTAWRVVRGIVDDSKQFDAWYQGVDGVVFVERVQ